MDNKIIGYRSDGTEVYEQKGFGSMCILYCEGCGKVLANTGGKKNVYCPSCAKTKGLVKDKK